jgi:hypothetical protein
MESRLCGAPEWNLPSPEGVTEEDTRLGGYRDGVLGRPGEVLGVTSNCNWITMSGGGYLCSP